MAMDPDDARERGKRSRLDSRRMRAQSETIGVILLVALVVVSLSTFSVFYLGSVDSDQGPTTDVDSRVTTDRLTLTHNGGEALVSDELRLVVRVDSDETGIDWHDDASVGAQFGPGEQWSVAVSDVRNSRVPFNRTDKVDVSLVHRPTQTTVFQRTVNPRPALSDPPTATPTTTPTATPTASPTATPTATPTASPTATPLPRDGEPPTLVDVTVVDDRSDRYREESRAEFTVRIDAADNRELATVSAELEWWFFGFVGHVDQDFESVSGETASVELDFREPNPSRNPFYRVTYTVTDAAGNMHTETVYFTL